MESNIPTIGRSVSQTLTTQGRVLRNTYALLALSMVPTVIGAIFGTAFLAPLMMGGSPWMFALLFLGGSFALMYGVEKTKNSGTGVIFLLLFTLFMGAMLGPILRVALHFSNGPMLIAMAAGGTGAIFFTLAGIASTTKRDFSNLGKFLTIGLVLLILASLANLFFQMPALYLTVSVVAVLLFSGFILYDINRIVQGGETNYISATLAVYLDIYNLFVNLLQLLMMFAGNDRD